MFLRRFLVVLPALVLLLSMGLVAQTPAPNVTGTWKGTIKIVIDDMPARDDTALMTLKQTGADVTGSVGPNEQDQNPISKGKVETVKGVTAVTFEITTEGPVILFELKIVEGRLKGTARAEFEGRKFRAELDVERAK